MRSQTLIAVADVELSSAWYQALLGCESLHGGNEYDRLAMPGEDSFFLQLHAWDIHDHPNLVGPDREPLGHGVLLWFFVDNFAETLERVQQLGASIVVEPHLNERASQNEVWLKDLDGYVVVIAGSQV